MLYSPALQRKRLSAGRGPMNSAVYRHAIREQVVLWTQSTQRTKHVSTDHVGDANDVARQEHGLHVRHVVELGGLRMLDAEVPQKRAAVGQLKLESEPHRHKEEANLR